MTGYFRPSVVVKVSESVKHCPPSLPAAVATDGLPMLNVSKFNRMAQMSENVKYPIELKKIHQYFRSYIQTNWDYSNYVIFECYTSMNQSR
jgi:hypothetical protein